MEQKPLTWEKDIVRACGTGDCVDRDFVEPFNIPLKNVVCMPGLDDADNFEERTQFCLEMAKKYRFTGLTRLHIAAWNKTLNV